MSDEENTAIVFPKPEGPVRHQVEPGESTDGGEETKAPAPTGPDGFGTETTFTVDNSTPGSTIVSEPLDEPPTGPGVGDLPIEFPYAVPSAGGLTIPNWVAIGEADIGVLSARYICCKFVALSTRRVKTITVMTTTGLNPAQLVDLGIYNNIGSVRLGSSGAVAIGAGFAPPFIVRQMITPFNIISGHLYTLAIRSNAGPALNLVGFIMSGLRNGMLTVDYTGTLTAAQRIQRYGLVTDLGDNGAPVNDPLPASIKAITDAGGTAALTNAGFLALIS